VIEVEYTSPVTAGLETPSRDSAMGGTARNYAAEVIDPDWAYERKWEWLHIVGHALGGNNESRQSGRRHVRCEYARMRLLHPLLMVHRGERPRMPTVN
jgi:hypothetical protein